MPKNSSIKMRTSASLIPTSSFQIARTNFISWGPSNGCPTPLADAGAAGQTFSTGRHAAKRRAMPQGATYSPGDRNGEWRAELRSTLGLAWPLILANLTQQLIQATDVLLMGRLGSTQLAAATLALNLTFTFNLLLLGLVIASSPMMATSLGQRFNAVRDVRRTFRAGLWLLAFTLPPYWLVLWHVGAIM